MRRIVFGIACLVLLQLSVSATRAATPSKPVCIGNGPVCQLVNRWFNEGTAAGNIGDYYDNRDGAHSTLRVDSYPQLNIVRYTAEEKAKKLDWGGQRRILRHVTIGNSSTSGRVRDGGSNARAWYYRSDQGMKFLYAQYRASNLYVYPEHRDHDDGHNGQPGYGDLFPTNSPYVVISQGSSGSDRAFLDAFVQSLAAFRPLVKQTLIANGLLMPTLQMIFRSTNKNIVETGDYLTAKAHPTVFDRRNLDPVKMVHAARNIRSGTVPPIVQLKVLEESRVEDDQAHFEVSESEQLADTPCVIARILRAPAYRKRMVISAQYSADINQRNLTYHWVVLRGDTQRIEIEYREGGAVAEISVPYHSRQPIALGASMESNRVDIGVFVHNGKTYSAPGFVTFYSLDNELRTYDDDGRLLEIYYNAADLKHHIFDWVALFEMIEQQNDDLPASLLTESFDDQELLAIRNVGQAYRSAYPTQIDAQTDQEHAKVEYNKAKAELKEHTKKLKESRAAMKANPGDETRAAAELAKADYETAVKAEQATKQQLNQAQAALKEARADAQKILSEKLSVFRDRSAPELVKEKLNAMKSDITFFLKHAASIRDWVGASSRKSYSKIEAARDLLMELDILKQMEDGTFVVQSIRTGDGSVEQRLTEFERYQITRFNQIILTGLLYPNFLKGTETKNFVDPRLTTARPWRDVFHYDQQGNRTGRERYDLHSLGSK